MPLRIGIVRVIGRMPPSGFLSWVAAGYPISGVINYHGNVRFAVELSSGSIVHSGGFLSIINMIRKAHAANHDRCQLQSAELSLQAMLEACVRYRPRTVHSRRSCPPRVL